MASPEPNNDLTDYLESQLMASMGLKAQPKKKAVMSNIKREALIEYVKSNIDGARNIIRVFKSDPTSRAIFELNSAQTLTVNVNGKYSKRPFSREEKLKLMSVYVGKRGDPILTFRHGKNIDDAVEIKLKDAFDILDGIETRLVDILGGDSIIEDRMKHLKSIEDAAESEKIRLEEEKRQERVKKLSKRAAFGTW